MISLERPKLQSSKFAHGRMYQDSPIFNLADQTTAPLICF